MEDNALKLFVIQLSQYSGTDKRLLGIANQAKTVLRLSDGVKEKRVSDFYEVVSQIDILNEKKAVVWFQQRRIQEIRYDIPGSPGYTPSSVLVRMEGGFLRNPNMRDSVVIDTTEESEEPIKFTR